MLRTLPLAIVALAALGAIGCGSDGAVVDSAQAAGDSLAAATASFTSPVPVAEPDGAVRAGRLVRTAGSPPSSSSAACRRPNPLAGKKFARMGVGGIVILGGGARSGIGGDLAAVLRAAPHGVKPFIASDEEGGLVQRLRDVIYPLPSARVQGGWSASKTRAAAEAYGARLRKLHVAVGVRAGRRPRHPRQVHQQPGQGVLSRPRRRRESRRWRG